MREADHTHIASPTPSGPRVSRRTALTALGALGALAATPTLAGPAAATTYPNPNSTPTSAIRTYGDMIKGLEQLQRTSRGTVTVTTLREVGTAEFLSEQGRELYVATVGTGARHLWIQGRIHGDEPYGLDSLMTVLKSLASSGNPTYRQIREQFSIHVIPVYNPDGSEMNTRTTTLWDAATNSPRLGANGRPLTVDLNRDWAVNGFRARESRAWYEYWTMVKPEYALDIHHQGMKVDRTTGEAITLSLGVSLAPGGPTLPGIRGGEYDVLTRQMAGYVWQKARGKLIQQNVLGVEAWLSGLATGAVQRLDPEIWEQIPHDPVRFYFTDWGGTIPA